MSTLTFTEETHTYEQDGEVIPSVTQVLELSGIVDVSGIPLVNLQKAADRGTNVHLACQYLDEDDLVLESIDPQVLGYVVAYQKFREEYNFRAVHIEHRMVGEVDGMRYGMTLDRIGVLDAPKVPLEGEILLDLKTSSKPSAAWPIQTAAYKLGYGNDGFARGVVHLKKDGTFTFLIHDQDETDSKVWSAALTLAYWRLKQ